MCIEDMSLDELIEKEYVPAKESFLRQFECFERQANSVEVLSPKSLAKC